MRINIKYFNKDLTKIKKVKAGDWLDLRCNGVTKVDADLTIEETGGIPLLKRTEIKQNIPFETGIFEGEEVQFVRYKKGDYMLINLGIAMELPEDHEAYVNPRGSTFKTFGFVQTNSQGVVDNIYKGDNDIWFMPVLAQKDGFIIFDERVCQFRIQKKMPKLDFNEVKRLGNEDRGGHGESGTK